MARRRGRGRRARAGRPSFRVDDIFTFTVEVGTIAAVTVGQLNNKPPNSDFAVRSITAECVSYSDKGTTVPAGIQLFLTNNGNGNAAQASRVLLVTEVPRTVTVTAPQPLWLQYNSADATKLAWMQGVCVGPPPGGSKVYVRGLIRLVLDVSTEAVPIQCPTVSLASDAFLPVPNARRALNAREGDGSSASTSGEDSWVGV